MIRWNFFAFTNPNPEKLIWIRIQVSISDLYQNVTVPEQRNHSLDFGSGLSCLIRIVSRKKNWGYDPLVDPHRFDANPDPDPDLNRRHNRNSVLARHQNDGSTTLISLKFIVCN